MDLILYNPLSNNKKSNIQTNKLIRKYKKNKTPFRLKNILKIQNIKEYLATKLNKEQVKAALHTSTSSLILAGA
jgi:ribosomal protein S30